MSKVLLVEDDNNLREIYEARLSAEGYEIVAAKDGEDALAVAKQHKPDLIISDVMMPRISGFEMLDILRNTDGLKNVKIIMLTALGQADDRSRAETMGADRYLVKSQVTLEDIVNSAAELLDPEYVPEGVKSSEAPAAAEPTPANPEAQAAIPGVTPLVPATESPTPVTPENVAVAQPPASLVPAASATPVSAQQTPQPIAQPPTASEPAALQQPSVQPTPGMAPVALTPSPASEVANPQPIVNDSPTALATPPQDGVPLPNPATTVQPSAPLTPAAPATVESVQSVPHMAPASNNTEPQTMPEPSEPISTAGMPEELTLPSIPSPATTSSGFMASGVALAASDSPPNLDPTPTTATAPVASSISEANYQPKPVAEPVPAPADPHEAPVMQMPTNSSESAAVDAQSVAQEEATVQEQIKSFEANDIPQITIDESVNEPTKVIDTGSSSEDTSDTEPENEQDGSEREALIASAMQNLQSPAQPVMSDQASQSVAGSKAPEAASIDSVAPSSSGSQIPGKKVIQPISSPANQKDLSELVAQEEIKENLEKGVTGTAVVADPAQPTPEPGVTPTLQQITTQPAQPGGVFVPNSGNAQDDAL